LRRIFLRESIAPSSIKPGIVVWKGQPFWGSQQAFLSGEGAADKNQRLRRAG